MTRHSILLPPPPPPPPTPFCMQVSSPSPPCIYPTPHPTTNSFLPLSLWVSPSSLFPLSACLSPLLPPPSPPVCMPLSTSPSTQPPLSACLSPLLPPPSPPVCMPLSTSPSTQPPPVCMPLSNSTSIQPSPPPPPNCSFCVSAPTPNLKCYTNTERCYRLLKTNSTVLTSASTRCN